ncbi:MAG: FAD-dependent oxidoreductase [Thermoleophilaceae bacterium]|nr:FAD-dependent oxidoreductase [Thermoleophilaceae bacterium]
MSEFQVVVCGGGIAACEALLRLRRLAGDALEVTVVSPRAELVYRPLAVREPFAAGDARRYPFERIARDAGARWVRDSLAAVDLPRRVVRTQEGGEQPYDALLLAVGARLEAPFEHAQLFTGEGGETPFHGLVEDIERGYTRSVAFVIPDGPFWPLPLYELALMARARADSMGVDDLALHFVTPEPAPLAVFGSRASEAVSRLLAEARIEVLVSARASVPAKRELLVLPHGVTLHPERIVALPRMSGPDIPGLEAKGGRGFVPVDNTAAVPGTDGRVFAAGDITDMPVKQGGIGAQQADAAAAAIARLAGVETELEPFAPRIDGVLLTGGRPLYLTARLVGPAGFQSEVHEQPPWPAGEKVVARELGPYLERLDGSGSGSG